MSGPFRHCVLLFSHSPRAEARAKGLRDGEALFALAHRRVAAAVATLPGVDLVVVGTTAAGLRPAHRLPQRGHTFGDRLLNAFSDARALGYQQVIAVGGDVPGLGAGALRSAFRRLANHDVVLGPSPDGGVYLIGVRGSFDGLLDGVRWHTGTVCADLQARAPVAALLDRLADVDAPHDLALLERSAAADPALRSVLRRLRAASPPPRPGSGTGPLGLVWTSAEVRRGPPARP